MIPQAPGREPTPAAAPAHVATEEAAERPSASQPVRRSRVVLGAAVGVAVAIAVLLAVIASAQPSSEVAGKSPLLGQSAPAIAGRGLEGGRYTLSEFRGKWVLVNFMASWCPPCKQEMPQLRKFSAEHSRRGDAVVLSVVEDPSDVGALSAYLARSGARWPAVDDPSAQVAYGVVGMPTSFLVAPDGIVYWYLLGKVQAKQLDRLLTEGAASGLGPA